MSILSSPPSLPSTFGRMVARCRTNTQTSYVPGYAVTCRAGLCGPRSSSIGNHRPCERHEPRVTVPCDVQVSVDWLFDSSRSKHQAPDTPAHARGTSRLTAVRPFPPPISGSWPTRKMEEKSFVTAGKTWLVITHTN